MNQREAEFHYGRFTGVFVPSVLEGTIAVMEETPYVPQTLNGTETLG